MDSKNSEELINLLSEYVATMIFKLHDKNKHEELSKEMIKDKFIQEKEKIGFLELFCFGQNVEK
jgi:hypothetical protein